MADLTIFYDGLCPLCSREMDHYRPKVRDGSVAFVDITADDFDAGKFQLDPVAIHRHMHVLYQNRIRTGVDAFLAIWEVIPGYRWLRAIIGTPGIYFFAKIGYSIFARLRPLLPRKKRECEGEQCRVE